MQEIELKFQIPAESLEAVRAELARLALAQAGNNMALQAPLILQAAYFDTPDRKLARARSALRVRREGDDWVQTLKAAGAHAMSRLEDNQPTAAPQPGEPIRPDLTLHQGDARLALVRDLDWQPDEDPMGARTGLVQLYRTDIRRLRATQAVQRSDGHFLGLVELALDLGDISAGASHSTVCELEIELLDGHPKAVIEAARGLVRAHGLWLDTQTKAHRGDQLAREAELGQPSPAAPARPRSMLRPGMSPHEARGSGLSACLEQVTLNQAEVALGGAHPDPWVRAWVVGLRRLRLLGGHPQVDTAATNCLLRSLHPSPSTWASQHEAAQLARAPATTELTLNLLAQLV